MLMILMSVLHLRFAYHTDMKISPRSLSQPLYSNGKKDVPDCWCGPYKNIPKYVEPCQIPFYSTSIRRNFENRHIHLSYLLFPDGSWDTVFSSCQIMWPSRLPYKLANHFAFTSGPSATLRQNEEFEPKS